NKIYKKSPKSFRFFKIIYFSISNAFKNKCFLRASALTYYSLMAIVPFFALIFGIGQIFGYAKNLESDLLERFHEQQELLSELIRFANNLLKEARGGVIALLGVLFLFISLIKLFSHMEASLNIIWKAKRRKLKNTIGLYLSLLFVIPIFLVLFTSVKVYIFSVFEDKTLIDTFLEKFVYFIFYFSPLILTYAFFSFIYYFLPNANAHFKPALIGAVFSGSLYQIVQFLYVNFQAGFTRYNAIYGSFTAVPLFLIWLQFSWIIFLLGAELSYAIDKNKAFKLPN
ncbi:MAG: YihY/virulence factor BrkB family protein, partial [Parachlamydiales bacterium]|nr:YihY/virulence factor BrkB family protein [Parachlamydiales bacterium]